MRRPLLAALLVFLLIAVGCRKGSSAGERCEVVRARFEQAYAARVDTCQTDAECGCYNPVGGPQMGCGGVTDAATAKKLAAIEAEFHAASCSWTHQCGPRVCTPRSVSGRCQP